MTTATVLRPPYLPREAAPLGLVTMDGSWNAVTVPAAWGHLVLDVLADRSGPVLEDTVAGHLLWVIPPESADAWPDAARAGVQVHGEGAHLTVCGLAGYRTGMRWLRVPTARRWDTDARLLRLGLEWIIGPLGRRRRYRCASPAAPRPRTATSWPGTSVMRGPAGRCTPARPAGRRSSAVAPAATSAW